MPFILYLVAAVVAYLLGSIPFGYLLVRLFRKEDIREKGSGNIGATNVMRSGSKGLGAVTFLLDVLKGFCAVWLCNAYALHAGVRWNVRLNAIALAALCVVLGHIFTMWLGFKGGKGVATAFGVFIALAPWAALAGLGVFVLVFAAFRYVSLASIVSAATFPVFAIFLSRTSGTLLADGVTIAIPLIVILRHHQNIGRLMSGTEYRFGKSRAAKSGTTTV